MTVFIPEELERKISAAGLALPIRQPSPFLRQMAEPEAALARLRAIAGPEFTRRAIRLMHREGASAQVLAERFAAGWTLAEDLTWVAPPPVLSEELEHKVFAVASIMQKTRRLSVSLRWPRWLRWIPRGWWWAADRLHELHKVI